MNRFFAPLAFVVLLGCRPEQLHDVSSKLRFEVPDTSPTRDTTPNLDFGATWATTTTSKQLRVINEGILTVDVSWSNLDAPFAISNLPARLIPGVTDLSVSFQPLEAGNSVQQLEVSSDAAQGASITIKGRGLAIPLCAPSNACSTAVFDVGLNRCVESTLPDDTPCDAHTKCLLDTTCQSGRCVGKDVKCDDGNACTVDVCQVELGCEFLPAPPCPGDGACQVGTCDPKSGCGLKPAPDGTQCGPLQSCSVADVCIEGACVKRDPPDGFVCEEASPCREKGLCEGDTCVHVSAAPRVLKPNWSFDALDTADPDAGVAPVQYHDFVLEPAGQLTIGGFFNAPAILRANTASRVPAPEGTSRRCILWNSRLVCADYPAQPENGKVSALDVESGQTEWTYNIRTARPDFLAVTRTIFLARLVVQGSDRLAALFEAYPLAPPMNDERNLCRSYFLAVIDASGRPVMSQPITDPLLDDCNHPHPYGVAADSIGNLYIAFSPTRTLQAPLEPGTPTLIISYTHDGLFRWKRVETLIRGGELAVARGLLYPENSSVVLNAPTGEPAFALPGEIGRAVISNTRLIPSPLNGSSALNGYEAGQTMLRWTHQLAPGWSFWGEQLRLASWQTSHGPRTVALTFTTDATGAHALHAVDAQFGFDAFTCQVQLPERTEPQLFEVANGQLAVMEGGLDPQGNPGCLKCDPPLANSSAAFQVIEIPGVSMANEAWVGTFGGAGHDHQED